MGVENWTTMKLVILSAFVLGAFALPDGHMKNEMVSNDEDGGMSFWDKIRESVMGDDEEMGKGEMDDHDKKGEKGEMGDHGKKDRKGKMDEHRGDTNDHDHEHMNDHDERGDHGKKGGKGEMDDHDKKDGIGKMDEHRGDMDEDMAIEKMSQIIINNNP